MMVVGIRGRRVGVVTLLRPSCFEVKRPPEEGPAICLKPEAIFNVDKEGITLICAKEDIERYLCGAEHAGAADLPRG